MHRTVRRLAALTALTTAGFARTVGTASAQDEEVSEPASFTSMFTAMATPGMVVDAGGAATPGQPGATGTFNYRINSGDDVICYDITLRGVTPPFMSPARTATHIHQAAPGKPGPPRLAFPNPEDAGNGTVNSSGCLQGPFTTGIMANGADTGAGFTVAQIEADPTSFFTDSHTARFTAGVVRGQLTSVPMGGVGTGAGGTAPGSADRDVAALPLALAALVGAGGVGAVLRRRTRS